MKKLLLLGALSLTVVGLATGQASAWFWDNLRGCHGCQCKLTVNYRPYNAFDPGCSGGSVHGNLGALFGGMGYGPGWVPPPLPSYNGPYASCCINSGCCDGGCLPAPFADPAPVAIPEGAAVPAPGGPAFTAPMPTPVPATSQMYYNPTPVAQNPYRPAGYYPNSYPGYYQNYPVGYYPQMQGYPMPYYPYGMPGNGQNYGR